jgi:hypothetical protein
VLAASVAGLSIATVTALDTAANTAHFTHARDGLGWPHERMCPGGRCELESVWPWTTGEPLAVLATRAQARQPWPAAVLAISTPMRSLIRPVLPPGSSSS